MRAAAASAALLALVSPAAGHGTMNTPPSRNAGVAPKGQTGGCENGACMFFSQGCTIGCKCDEDNTQASLLKRACNNTLEPSVNKRQWRTFNRDARAKAGSCDDKPSQTSNQFANFTCIAGSPGQWLSASCGSAKPQFCSYTDSACTKGTCVDLDGGCHTLLAGVKLRGKCVGLNATVAVYSGFSGDWTQYHPWRAPGTAIPLDACGLAGGSTKDNSAAGGYGNMTVAKKQGFPGSKLPPVDSPMEWRAGATVEVSWGIAANHGGGYQYRLCPKGEALTEECFMKRPLEFVGETQRLRWANGHEVEIPATRVSEGVVPAGAAWTMNPIPACNSSSGGYQGEGCEAPQFPPPAGCNETCWGYQPCRGPVRRGPCNTKEIPDIVDTVKVPADLQPGEYIVGWRWDCEQTVQVWSGCGGVRVSA